MASSSELRDLSTSFENIDLDESSDSLAADRQATLQTSPNNKQETEHKSLDGRINESSGNTHIDDGDKRTPTNDQLLDRLANELMNDYRKYFHLDSSSQMNELNDCIENVLTHMEEFYGLVEMLRHDSVCVEQLTATVNAKIAQSNDTFRMIDKLERIVGHVGAQLSLMEREVSKAESMMMVKRNPVKRLFSQFIGGNSGGEASRNAAAYSPFEIFKTEDLMKL